MELILPAMEGVGKVCGAQKLREGVPCRLSLHCIPVPVDEGTLLYHTLTGALALLPAGEELEDDWDALVTHWFLVPEDFDERAHADGVRRIMKLLQPAARHKTRFTILTTTDCNARCFYCYELGIRRFPMAAQTARDAADYIARVCGGEPVRLSWFGGEPLYNRQAIEIICGRLREAGVEYKSRMVSNGYYLDAATARTAFDDWHLRRVQITIDGTEAVYNRTKAYIDRDDGSPFRRVLENIGGALDAGIEVTVRLNMDAKNAEDLEDLADELAARFGGRENFRVYAALLQTFAGSVHAFESQRQAVERFLTLEGKLEALGLLKPKPLPRKLRANYCMADDDASETILPDGRIYACEHYAETETMGSIYDDARDAAQIAAWKARVRQTECEGCALYPMCLKLEKCEWYRDGCTQATRSIETEALKRQILAAYREAKDGRKQA